MSAVRICLLVSAVLFSACRDRPTPPAPTPPAASTPASDGPVPLGESAYVTSDGTIVKTRVAGAREVVCTFEPFRAADNWGFMSTAAMVWNSTAPAFLQACDLDRPCRDEYVCMRRPVRADASLRDPHQGACVAGYVLAQLEIDAHKIP